MDVTYAVIYRQYHDEMLSGLFKNGVERLKAFTDLMSWPEEIEARNDTETDRMARESAASLGNDVDSMVTKAWEERQRAIAEWQAQQEAAAVEGDLARQGREAMEALSAVETVEDITE